MGRLVRAAAGAAQNRLASLPDACLPEVLLVSTRLDRLLPDSAPLAVAVVAGR
jgi:hypothetical protein